MEEGGGSATAELPDMSSICLNTVSCNHDERNLDVLNPDDDSSYTIVQKRKKRRSASISAIGETSTLPSTRRRHGLTVIVKPKDPARQISKVNPLKLLDKLDSLAPDGVLRVRPNPRLNLLALDTRNNESTRSLLALTSVEGISVKTYEP